MVVAVENGIPRQSMQLYIPLQSMQLHILGSVKREVKKAPQTNKQTNKKRMSLTQISRTPLVFLWTSPAQKIRHKSELVFLVL